MRMRPAGRRIAVRALSARGRRAAGRCARVAAQITLARCRQGSRKPGRGRAAADDSHAAGGRRRREAAVPLAALVADPDRSVQLAAIAAELNFFLDEQLEGRRRSPCRRSRPVCSRWGWKPSRSKC